MKVAGIQEVRSHLGSVLGSEEPVVVTRRGKVSGIYLPLEDRDSESQALRRELAKVVGRHLRELTDLQGVTEEEIQADFNAYRARRRGRR